MPEQLVAYALVLFVGVPGMTWLLLEDCRRAEQRRFYRRVSALPEFQRINHAFIHMRTELVDRLTPALQQAALAVAELVPVLERLAPARPTWRTRIRRAVRNWKL